MRLVDLLEIEANITEDAKRATRSKGVVKRFANKKITQYLELAEPEGDSNQPSHIIGLGLHPVVLALKKKH